MVNQALAGAEPDDVSKLLRGLARTTKGLSRNERQLQELLVNFNATVGATAAESSNLRAAVRELGPTIEHADGALTELNAALPPTRIFARRDPAGVRETPATVDATFPWIRDIRPLLSQAELRGLVADLQPGTEALAHVSSQSLPLLRETSLLSRCVTGNFLPVQNSKLDDGSASVDATVSRSSGTRWSGSRARARTSTATATTCTFPGRRRELPRAPGRRPPRVAGQPDAGPHGHLLRRAAGQAAGHAPRLAEQQAAVPARRPLLHAEAPEPRRQDGSL